MVTLLPEVSADLELLPRSWPVAVWQGPPDTPSRAALEPPLFSKSVPQRFATLRWENVFFLFHLQIFSSAPEFNCSKEDGPWQLYSIWGKKSYVPPTM